MLEVGSGGFNAELLAHVVGRRGHVVTVELEPLLPQQRTPPDSSTRTSDATTP